MRIYTKAGDLAFKTFTFPDGQPHFKLETYEREFDSVCVETAIKSPSDLFMVLLVADVLRQHGYKEISLDVRYLMAARMDRAIDTLQPYTLQTVARLINGAGFTSVRILDVHSEVATRLIRNAMNVLPYTVVRQVINTVGDVHAVRPDKGAQDRVATLIGEGIPYRSLIKCEKSRDIQTGALTGFSVNNHPSTGGWDCLIIDDICDGGGTFIGLAKELRKAGAAKVYLYVTHGIFSKGIRLEGIDRIYCTDSYSSDQVNHSTIYDIKGDPIRWEPFTVVPISMKDLK